ncbi:MAG: exosortase C-terminal domain/associated protein EpsI [Gemmatimonadota bacterium]
MSNARQWIPGGIMGIGCLFTLFIDRQQQVPLAAPLATLPTVMAGFEGQEVPISKEEQAVAGMSAYSFRSFQKDSLGDFSVYVGYYDHQTQGKTIHSPKNCLPGSGWEALKQSEVRIETPAGPETVNRYLLQNGQQRALVYYWYQGRGRVAANEYRVKWELLRDSAISGRSEEALVRIVVPLRPGRDETEAAQLATSVTKELIPAVFKVLPS